MPARQKCRAKAYSEAVVALHDYNYLLDSCSGHEGGARPRTSSHYVHHYDALINERVEEAMRESRSRIYLLHVRERRGHWIHHIGLSSQHEGAKCITTRCYTVCKLRNDT